MPTLITLTTKEGPVIYLKEILACLSETIQHLLLDFPDATELETTITKHQLDLALMFLGTLTPAQNKQDWYDMIIGLEYLQIIPRYQELLIEEAKKFMQKQHISFMHRLSPLEALKKLDNPSYKSSCEVAYEQREQQLNTIVHCDHTQCFRNCPHRDLENLGL